MTDNNKYYHQPSDVINPVNLLFKIAAHAYISTTLRDEIPLYL